MGDNDNNLESIIIGCLGESGVGKTYLTRKYVHDNNVDFNIPTVGIEYFMIKKILSNGKKYKIKIYDTAGQERYKSLALNSIRHCEGVILMYDITNRKSFDSISEWTNNIYELKDHDFPFILIGNKCDLKDQREVSEEEGFEKAEKYKVTYYETSAKEGINIEKPIDELLNNIIKKYEESIDRIKEKSNEKVNNINLAQKKNNKRKNKCC